MAKNTRIENFLRQFRDEASKELNRLNATQFMEIWNHYDLDGNGFIEGKELDKFLSELCTSVNSSDVEAVPESILEQFKETILDAYDENSDGKISVQELAEILPTDENFLLIFRKDNQVDSTNFMKIWIEFDKDKSGFIESDELKNFISKLIDANKQKSLEISEEKLEEYTQSILKIFDRNADGKLQLSEMIKLLTPQENTNLKSIFNSFSAIKKDELDQIFDCYDKDGNEQISGDEIDQLAKDLMELMRKDYSTDDFSSFKNGLMKLGDINKDGYLSKQELKLILMTITSKNVEN